MKGRGWKVGTTTEGKSRGDGVCLDRSVAPSIRSTSIPLPMFSSGPTALRSGNLEVAVLPQPHSSSRTPSRPRAQDNTLMSVGEI